MQMSHLGVHKLTISILYPACIKRLNFEQFYLRFKMAEICLEVNKERVIFASYIRCVSRKTDLREMKVLQMRENRLVQMLDERLKVALADHAKKFQQDMQVR